MYRYPSVSRVAARRRSGFIPGCRSESQRGIGPTTSPRNMVRTPVGDGARHGRRTARAARRALSDRGWCRAPAMAVALPELPGVTHHTVDVAGLRVHVAAAGRLDAP